MIEVQIWSQPTAWRLLFAVVVAIAALAAATLTVAAATRESAFAEETHVAMATMMAAMHVRMTGDVDRDFASMMIPHHQGAIDMALAEVRFGRNEQLRRLAQEIVVAQQQEIVVMQQVLRQSSPASVVHDGH